MVLLLEQSQKGTSTTLAPLNITVTLPGLCLHYVPENQALSLTQARFLNSLCQGCCCWYLWFELLIQFWYSILLALNTIIKISSYEGSLTGWLGTSFISNSQVPGAVTWFHTALLNAHNHNRKLGWACTVLYQSKRHPNFVISLKDFILHQIHSRGDTCSSFLFR